jgi:dipeptidase
MIIKICLTLVLFISLGFSNIYSCTNFIVTKGASTDGSIFITYNADAGGFMEPFYFMPAATHKPGEMVDVYDWDSGKYLGKIKQVAETYKVVGHINQHQVSIGETTFGGREELKDTTAVVDYGSLIQLALQRAKTAREAIKIMDELVQEYGYYSSGESFSVADANEVWMMEMITKGPFEKGAVWVARRIPDGYVAAHANQARIREIIENDPDNCMYSKDVVTFAIKRGYYDPKSGKKFSFVDAYAPLEPGGLFACEGRVWSLFRHAAPSMNFSSDYWRAVKGSEPYPLFIKPDKKLALKDVIDYMRDHFEGTEFDLTKGEAAGPYGCPVRWKGLYWKIEGDTVTKYAWERPISTQQTAFAFVSQLRNWLPNDIGGILWYGVDDNYTTVYMPLYISMEKPPYTIKVGSISDFTMESAFWVFNLVANYAYPRYSLMIKDIQAAQSKLESNFQNSQPAIEKAALDLYNTGKQDLAKEFLNDYTNNQVNKTVERWTELWKFLITKFNDGYINDVKVDNGRHPKSAGYSTDFLKNVVKSRPGYYEVKWKEKKSNNP